MLLLKMNKVRNLTRDEYKNQIIKASLRTESTLHMDSVGPHTVTRIGHSGAFKGEGEVKWG